jgi:hypothetical protein
MRAFHRTRGSVVRVAPIAEERRKTVPRGKSRAKGQASTGRAAGKGKPRKPNPPNERRMRMVHSSYAWLDVPPGVRWDDLRLRVDASGEVRANAAPALQILAASGQWRQTGAVPDPRIIVAVIVLWYEQRRREGLPEDPLAEILCEQAWTAVLDLAQEEGATFQ